MAALDTSLLEAPAKTAEAPTVPTPKASAKSKGKAKTTARKSATKKAATKKTTSRKSSAAKSTSTKAKAKTTAPTQASSPVVVSRGTKMGAVQQKRVESVLAPLNDVDKTDWVNLNVKVPPALNEALNGLAKQRGKNITKAVIVNTVLEWVVANSQADFDIVMDTDEVDINDAETPDEDNDQLAEDEVADAA